ncbi:hypothetical protein DRQ33_07615 [bacterium]|nr:MAG: hypothetical protein DRQ33_07615 [bacterium]
MKRMVLFGIIVAMVSIAIGDGTVRMRTGVGTWKIRRTDPDETKTAEIVPSGNEWDETMGDPNAWSKLYLDRVRWISWNSNGTDDYFGPRSYVYTSPNFYIPDKVSRATIWYAVDDEVELIALRRSTGPLVGAKPGESGFLNLHRADFTELFRQAYTRYGDGPYYLQFWVNNTSWIPYTGIIAYISFDYGLEKIFEYTFRYCPGSHFWVTFSMPFYHCTDATTLADLFPEADVAQYTTNGIDYTYTTSPDEVPLEGEIYDGLKTYTLLLHFDPDEWEDAGGVYHYEIPGIPIYEQRYLDYTTNDRFWFGTVDCVIDYEYPDDYPDGKMRPLYTHEWRNADGGGHYLTTTTITGRYGYAVYPDETLELPYHFDLRCNPMKNEGLLIENTLQTISYDIPSEILTELNSIEREPPPDSTDIIEYLAELERMERLGPDTTKGPKWIEPGLHKRTTDNKKPDKFSLSIFPNPFNKECKLIISSSGNSELTIKIFDIAGNLVNTLIPHKLDDNNYIIKWNGNDSNGNELPTGIYIIGVRSGDSVINRKVFLMK